MSYTAINISAVIEGEIFLTGCNYQKIFLYLQQILHANHMTGLIIQCNMTKHSYPKLFEDRKIRTVWDDEQEKWYSIPSPKAEPIKQWMAPTVFTSSMSLPAWECGLKHQYYNKNLPATAVSFAKYQCSYNQSQQ